MNLERNSEESPQRSLSPEASWSVRTYLEAVKEEYPARFGDEKEFEFRGLAGAYIRVAKVPERDGELPMAVYLVGAGDMYGDWDLDGGFELEYARSEGSWQTVVVLDFDRRYDCVIVAVYEDSQGVQAEVMDDKPIHSFVVNEGRKEGRLAGNIHPYDSWNIDLEWKS